MLNINSRNRLAVTCVDDYRIENDINQQKIRQQQHRRLKTKQNSRIESHRHQQQLQIIESVQLQTQNFTDDNCTDNTSLTSVTLIPPILIIVYILFIVLLLAIGYLCTYVL